MNGPFRDNFGTCLQATKGPLLKKGSATYRDVNGKSLIVPLTPTEVSVLKIKHGK